MTETEASFLRRAVAASSLWLAIVVPAAAQQRPAPTPSAPDFLSRYDFHLAGIALGVDDKRFSWDAHFGGELDVVDYVRGRASIAVDYEVLLGDEFRLFDPNQGNYILEASSSARAGPLELVGVFHHVSRHVSDRSKRFAIAWNTLGARALRRWSVGDTTLDLNLDGGKVVQHAYVDYTWIGQVDLLIRRRLSPRTSAFAHGTGQMFGADRLFAGRSRLTGGLVEAGVRLSGLAGAVELFAGYEKRVDADQIDLKPQHWVTAGFRIVNR